MNATDPSNGTMPAADDSDSCGSVTNEVDLLGLRIASLFIIGATSLFGALFPILARRSTFIKVPKLAFEFAKYFGSGVIIATSFIHLLSPALDELGSDCLTGTWQTYPWALALAMLSVFLIFFVELIAFRWGTSKLQALGVEIHDAHGHDVGPDGVHAAHGPERLQEEAKSIDSKVEEGRSQKASTPSVLDATISKIIGIAILEFGIVLHSVLIGLTLAVNEDFKILFIVLVFHQMFEGLGLGSRLAYLDLAPKYRWIPIVGACLYALTTPIGIAIGLGVRTSYNPDSKTAAIVSGVLDALSAGILLYTGLVELLAHEFLFNPTMTKASTKHVTFASVCMVAGAGIMALLGNWA